jgi:hypothetical protein
MHTAYKNWLSFIYGTSYIAQKLKMRIIVKDAQNAIQIFDPAFLIITQLGVVTLVFQVQFDIDQP